MEQYTLFKPNKNVTGALISFKVSQDKNGEPCLWINLVKQAGWSNGKGSFGQNAKDKEKSLNAKFNLLEIAGIIRAIKEKSDFSAYHGFDNASLQVSMKYSEKEWNKKILQGFYLNFTRNGSDKFSISLARDTEAYGLALFLEAQAFSAPAVKNILEPKTFGEKNPVTVTIKNEVKQEKKEETEEDNPFLPEEKSSSENELEESPF